MADPAKSPDSPRDEEPSVDLTGRILGDFRLLRKLGQGGMGQVYLARQQSLKRDVALKILRRELAENATALKRFQGEAEAVARISHPNIVQVYAIGASDGQRYMALEYVEGRNLRDYLDRKGPPELPVALAIMRQVAAALQRASELGLVHRDIKPENILVTRKVEVKVTDFGLSRYFGGDGKPVSLTQSGMTLGTPLYMSPEQVQGKVVDHRSDLYSFGVTCYHLLAGSPPYRGSNAFEVAVQHVQSEPEPLEHLRPDLPADLCALVHKLMAKDIESRYQSAKDVLRDLTKIQKGLTLGIANATGTSQPNLGATSQLQSSPLQVSLSGGTLGSVNAVSLPSAPSIPVPTSTEPTRWPWRMLGILGLSAAGIGGWWLFDQLAPVPATKTPVAIVGLPDTRPAHFTTAYESKLKDQFRSKLSPPLQIKVGLELGLHYVYQRRWDEANELFKELEAIRIPKATADVPVPATLIGKFGLAIVLAHQDKVKPALEAFLSAEASLRALRVPAARTEIERFFFTNTEFGLAVAEALNRLAEIEKLPPALEWLRTPNGILRGPR